MTEILNSLTSHKTPRYPNVIKERDDSGQSSQRSRVNCLVANMTISVQAARNRWHYTGGLFDLPKTGDHPAKKAEIIRPENTLTCGQCGHACMN